MVRKDTPDYKAGYTQGYRAGTETRERQLREIDRLNERYDNLWQQWKDLVVSETQLKRLLTTANDQISQLLSGKTEQRRRVMEEKDELDKYGFPQPNAFQDE